MHAALVEATEGDEVIEEPVRASLRALAAQVALALARADLTEEVHRRGRGASARSSGTPAT